MGAFGFEGFRIWGGSVVSRGVQGFEIFGV